MEKIDEKELKNPIKFFQRIYNVVMDGSYEKKFKKCNYIFLQELDNIGVLDTKLIDEAFDYGYQQALTQLEALREYLEN